MDETEFRISDHKIVPGRKVVEVWVNGKFVATITATQEGSGGFRVFSNHLDLTEDYDGDEIQVWTFRPRRG